MWGRSGKLAVRDGWKLLPFLVLGFSAAVGAAPAVLAAQVTSAE